MLTRTKAAAAGLVLIATPLTIATTAGEASAAAKYYSSCDQLNRDWEHGVSRNAKAAAKQVRDGYGRPASGKKAQAVYRENGARLDGDDDGTACER